MEDNKKTVEMKPIIGGKKRMIEKKPVGAAENAPSTEQLTQLVDQLYGRNQQLVEALNEKNTALMFKRMDYLFKVLEYAHMFEDDFIFKCAKELKDTLDIVEDKKEEELTQEDGEQDQ